MKTPSKHSAAFEISQRVTVRIQEPSRYAAGAAESLHGLTGVLEQFKPDSINGEHGIGPAWLVRFDKPAKRWWTHQTPPGAFWFPPCDLA